MSAQLILGGIFAHSSGAPIPLSRNVDYFTVFHGSQSQILKGLIARLRLDREKNQRDSNGPTEAPIGG
jgi:hypothetical protein